MRYNNGMTRRRWLVVACGALAVGLAGVGGYALSVRQAGEDVRGSATVEFVTTDAPAPSRPPSTTTPPQPSTPVETIAWGTYGYDDRRTRFDPNVGLRPPFRRIWTFRGRALLEFPPAVAYGRVFLPDLRRPLLRAGRPHREDDLEPPQPALRLGLACGQWPARVRHVHRTTLDVRRLGARGRRHRRRLRRRQRARSCGSGRQG